MMQPPKPRFLCAAACVLNSLRRLQSSNFALRKISPDELAPGV